MFDFKAVRTPAKGGKKLELEPPFSARKVSIEDAYQPEDGLLEAADVAMILGTPLLLTGEPGSGKTSAAYYLASQLNLPKPFEHDVKSSSTAKDLLYEFDEVARFRDSSAREKRKPLISYLRMNALGEAIIRASGGDTVLTDPFGRPANPELVRNAFGTGPDKPYARLLLNSAEDDPVASDPEIRIVLLDEIDKAARDTPNDLLAEIDRMSFTIPELGLRVSAAPEVRPIVIMTSNSEKSLPEPFLRRCAFFHIPLPDAERMKEIVARTFKNVSFGSTSIDQMIEFFFLVRSLPEIIKRPSTSELIAWIDAIQQRKVLGDTFTFEQARRDPEQRQRLADTLGAMLKNKEDLEAGRNMLLPAD